MMTRLGKYEGGAATTTEHDDNNKTPSDVKPVDLLLMEDATLEYTKSQNEDIKLSRRNRIMYKIWWGFININN